MSPSESLWIRKQFLQSVESVATEECNPSFACSKSAGCSPPLDFRLMVGQASISWIAHRSAGDLKDRMSMLQFAANCRVLSDLLYWEAKRGGVYYGQTFCKPVYEVRFHPGSYCRSKWGIEKTLNRQQLGSDLVKVSGSSISTVWVGSDPFKKWHGPLLPELNTWRRGVVLPNWIPCCKRCRFRARHAEQSLKSLEHSREGKVRVNEGWISLRTG